MIEFQQLYIEDGHVFGLKKFLFGAQKVVLFGKEFHGILHAEIELFAYEVETCLAAFDPFCRRQVLLLCAPCVQPEVFYGPVEFLFRLPELQFRGFETYLGLFYGAFVCLRLKIGTLSVSPTELFHPFLICSEKV